MPSREIMENQPLFSAIIHTYNRPHLLKISLEALQRQTYSNIEIILVNNGGTPDTISYLESIKHQDPRIKVVDFAENQYHPDDPMLIVEICWNAGLAEATGDYVWVQEDDDYLAPEYAEKMVALFQHNPECTTAAGLPVSINEDGQVNPVDLSGKNVRPRYTPGYELAMDQFSGSRKMFAAPGSIFTIKRDVLLEAGGYHRSIESSHLYGIVPFGVTGFDPNALFYWRHHEAQLNKQLSVKGWIGTNESLDLLRDWNLEERWSVFGADVSRRFVWSYKNQVYDAAASWFVISLYSFRPRAAIRIMLNAWLNTHFWTRVFAHAVARRNIANVIAPVIKPPLKILFRILPGLAKLIPGLGAKVDRWT
jgi:glycosyltransferase involved in cell wall biosynthesis